MFPNKLANNFHIILFNLSYALLLLPFSTCGLGYTIKAHIVRHEWLLMILFISDRNQTYNQVHSIVFYAWLQSSWGQHWNMLSLDIHWCSCQSIHAISHYWNKGHLSVSLSHLLWLIMRFGQTVDVHAWMMLFLHNTLRIAMLSIVNALAVSFQLT